MDIELRENLFKQRWSERQGNRPLNNLGNTTNDGLGLIFHLNAQKVFQFKSNNY